MTTVFDLQMQGRLSGSIGSIGDCKLMFPRPKMEVHKAPNLRVRHLLVTIEKPTSKGSRADGNESFSHTLFGGKSN